MYSKATFVSVWDGGIEIRSNCLFNTETKDITDIETIDIDGLEVLMDEYVELEGGEKVSVKECSVEGEPQEELPY